MCQCKRHKDVGLIPGSGRSLEKGMAIDSSILAWRIPWTEEPGRLQSIGSQRFGHDWSDLACNTQKGNKIYALVLQRACTYCVNYAYSLVDYKKYWIIYHQWRRKTTKLNGKVPTFLPTSLMTKGFDFKKKSIYNRYWSYLYSYLKLLSLVVILHLNSRL